MTRACTRLRISVIARCAATPRICELRNDVTAWIAVATPPAIAIGSSSSWRPLPMTSSTRYFDEAGSTRPARRLISISTRPRASRWRCAQSSSRASRHAAEADTFFLPAAAVVGRTRRHRRSAAPCAPRAPCSGRRIAMNGHRQLSALGTASVNGAIRASNVSPLGPHHRVAAVHRADVGLQRDNSSCTRSSCPARAPAARRRRRRRGLPALRRRRR